MINNKLLASNKNAIVFGLFETGLGVIRSLGRKGIKVIGIDYKKDIGWYSRYVHPVMCPNPVSSRLEFVKWVHDTFGEISHKIPIFITGDDFLHVISAEREQFKQYFEFTLASDQLLKEVSDKYLQYQLALKSGIEAPSTWVLRDSDDIKKIENNKSWPLIMKGLEVNSWRKIFGGSFKGFSIHNFETLKEKSSLALEQGVPVILQEIIEGPDTNHYKYCAYISESGTILAELCLRKIRQRPIRFGVGSVVESIIDSELADTGRRFLNGINYRGVGSVEFKRDLKDGKLKLIELNTRYWQQNALAEVCNVNFAWINYQDLKGMKPEPILFYNPKIKWVNRYMDFESFLAYNKEKSLSFSEWRKSLRGKKVYSDFSWDDPIPALYEIGFGMKLLKIPAFIIKKVF